MNKLYMKSCCPNQNRTVGLKRWHPIRPNNINQLECGSVFSKAAAAAAFYEVVRVGFFCVCAFLMSVHVFQNHNSFVPENRW